MKNLVCQTLFGIYVLLATQSAALAGVSDRGGGEIFDTSTNPWFLGNVTNVSYCISIDEEKMGISRAEAEKSIQLAFSYWKRSLATARTPWDDNKFPNDKKFKSLFQLGTQNFNLSTCDERTDIKFQLGQLNSEQKSLLEKDLDRIIAMTQMTQYDRELLRAKGFIYVASMDGIAGKKLIDRIQAAGNVSLYGGPNNWGYIHAGDAYNLFTLAMIHEVGHIFGVGHNLEIPFMDEEYVQNLFIHGGAAKGVEWIKTNFFNYDIKNFSQKVSLKFLNEEVFNTICKEFYVHSPCHREDQFSIENGKLTFPSGSAVLKRAQTSWKVLVPFRFPREQKVVPIEDSFSVFARSFDGLAKYRSLDFDGLFYENGFAELHPLTLSIDLYNRASIQPFSTQP